MARRTPPSKRAPPKKRKRVPRKAAAKQRRAGYHHGDLKQALLNAALAILDERGLGDLTLRECARRAGVSHAAPAHHFGDARGLLTEVTAVCFEQFGEGMTRARIGAPAVPFEQLLAIGGAYVQYALEYPARFRLMFRTDHHQTSPRLTQADDASYRHLRECIAATDRAGGGDGRLLEEKAALAHSMVHGFATLVLENPGYGKQLRHTPDQALRFLVRMLRQAQPAFESPVNSSDGVV